MTLPPDPIQEQPTYEGALAAFEALPQIRVLFDNGAGEAPVGGTNAAGNPYPGFEKTFSKFPIPGTKAQTWYLGAGGTLNEKPASSEGVDTYTSDANATPLTDYGSNTGGGGLWSTASKWEYNWVQNAPGSAVSYVSAPLAADTTAVGGGAVHLWVKSSTPDVDLQATVSEVRPDGNETFVQNGWMRASERKLATDSKNLFKQKPTLLQPISTMLASDVEPMPADQFVPVDDPAVLPGARLPGGLAHQDHDRGAQRNAADLVVQPHAAERHDRERVESRSRPSMPSSLILPIVPGVSVPTALPACPSLRNEPCRTYQAFANNGS